MMMLLSFMSDCHMTVIELMPPAGNSVVYKYLYMTYKLSLLFSNKSFFKSANLKSLMLV